MPTECTPESFDFGTAEGRRIIAAFDAGRVPVSKILGVGAATARKLEAIGITTIRALRTLPEPDLVARFGKFGRQLARFARGEDDREVIAERAAKSVSAETTFASNLRHAEQLAKALRPLCDRVAGRLAHAGLAGRTVVLKLKTADFHVITRHHRPAAPTRRAEVIFRTAMPLIIREADGRAFRLIGIGVTDLCAASLPSQ